MVIINKEKCVGCGICVKDCIALNITIVDKKAEVKEDCLQCGHCIAVCPKAAVSIPEYDMDDIEEYEKDSFTINPEHFLHAIKFRRSIRSYKAKKVEKEKLEKLAEAGRYSATAENLQTSQFVFVQENLDKMKEYVWDYIDAIKEDEAADVLKPFLMFNKRRKADPADDYLFRNAPALVLVTSDRMLDAGLAAQNMEMLAVSMGLGAMYNGYLVRIVEENQELKKWLNIEDKTVRACMLLGYPDVHYLRTAPRKPAQIIWR